MIKPKIAVILANFYDHISQLQEEAIGEYCQKNDYTYDIYRLSGALEIPPLIAILGNNYDIYVALGCVIRGETTHYDIVAQETSRAIMDLNIKHHYCIGNGVLTVENEAQALARADKNNMNKAAGALVAALELYNYKQSR